MIDIQLGDCLEILKKLPDNSVDSLVTDPPAGISFMNKSWDDNKGGRDQWIAWLTEVMKEVNRVLKPGSHGLVWAIPRTSHWTAMALENAGFEIRDCVTHLFGTGFPKSLNISKAIDKEAGVERKIVGTRIKAGDIKSGRMHSGSNEVGVKTEIEYTVSETEEGKKWEGFGTALKPSAEFWWLIRKPISEKTVAKNVLKWGCGGLNIDGTRIGLPPAPRNAPKPKMNSGNFHAGQNKDNVQMSHFNPTQGRFPSNVVFSHSIFCTDDSCHEGCAVKTLDEQSGNLRTGGNKRSQGKGGIFAGGGISSQDIFANDSGTASRFFYCSKVSPSERDDSTHPTMKSLKLMQYLCRLVTSPNGLVLDPFMGSGSTGVAVVKEGFRFLGIEKEEEYFEIAKRRLAKV